MQLCVGLTANAGVSVNWSGVRFWVDALHERKAADFSALSREQFDRVLTHPSFRDPDVMIYTHDHGDHYSRAYTGEALEHFPAAQVWAPFRDGNVTEALENGPVRRRVGSLEFCFYPLTHEGAEYSRVPHRGFTVSDGRHTLLFPGDAKLGSAELLPILAKQRIDLAVLDFPWIATAPGRNFLEREMRPAHILVCHLPFAEDDGPGYRRAAAASVKRLSCPDVRLLLEPFQLETVEL